MEMTLFYLSKLLPLFVLPVGITLIVLVSGIVLRRRWMLITAAAVLWLSSMPLVGGRLMGLIEGDSIRVPASAAPAVDAIIVLSTSRAVAPGPAKISEWTDADRFFAGVELYQAGRAPLIVFTGGWLPGQPADLLEGNLLSQYAVALGVPVGSIVTTGRVMNTAQEAVAVAALLGARVPRPRHVLLVTSAFHMPRAQRLFQRAEFQVEPFPVDFAGGGDRIDLMSLLPDGGALAQTQRALRELYGRVYYGIRPL